MLKRKIIVAALAVAVMINLAGCGAKVGNIGMDSNKTAIYIQKDETIIYGVSESFDKGYYDKGDLKDAVKAEVEEYNASDIASSSDAIVLEKISVSKKNAIMILEFCTAYDFLSYIENYNAPADGTFYIGAIADNEDCKISGKFYEPENKKKTVAEDTIKELDANILIVNEAMEVQIDGTIQYVSENCKVKDGIVTTASADEGLSYIIYK